MVMLYSTKKRLGTMLVVMMIFCFIMIFGYPILYNYPFNAQFTYFDFVIIDFQKNFPLQPITFLMPLMGLIYLIVVTKTSKIVKAIREMIGYLTLIFLCLLFYYRIYTVWSKNNFKYKYHACAMSEVITKHPVDYKT